MEARFSASITSSAIVLALASLGSRAMGLLRDRLFAHTFGAGDLMDVYNAAFRIPDTIFMLLVLGALSAGFIPTFTKLWHKNPDEARALVAKTALVLTAMLLILCALTFALAGPLTALIAPGFSPEKQALTATLTRIMLVSPIIFGLSNIIGGVLQSLKRFLLFALAPIFYNAGIILGVLFLYPFFGAPGLAAGVVLGALLHLAVQIPGLKGVGFAFRLRIIPSPTLPPPSRKGEETKEGDRAKGRDWISYFSDPHLRAIARQALPRMVSLGLFQLNAFVVTSIASTLPIGSIAIYNFANNLQSFPVGILALSFAIAAFPTLAALVAKGNTEKLIATIETVTRQILFLMIPTTVLFLLLRAQIVRTVLGSGAFDWRATVDTADTLAFFALTLFAQALIPLLIRAFFALEDTVRPLIVGIAVWGTNIALAILFRDALGVKGLGLAYSAATVLHLVLLWVLLRMRLGTLRESQILPSLLKITAATLPMALAVQGAKYPLAAVVDMTRFWGIFSQGLFAGLAGIFVYLAFAKLFAVPELDWTLNAVKRRIGLKEPVQEVVHPGDGE